MGTSGFKVYRYRGIRRAKHIHHDSYPSGLGVDILNQIPRYSLAFELWLEDTRTWFDTEYKEGYSRHDVSFLDSREQPEKHLYQYEVDLDNLVFHMDFTPLFRLDCMPDKDTFLKSISRDNFGRRFYAMETPEEHRYEAVLSRQILPVSAETLQRYDAMMPTLATPAHVIGSGVLDTPNTRLVEFLVGFLIDGRRDVIFELETTFRQDDIWEESAKLAYLLVLVSIFPKFGSRERMRINPPLNGMDNGYWWPTKSICVRLVPQLQDADTMKAAIVDVTRIIGFRSRPHENTTLFGILFNILHICILRISYKEDGQQIIEHTDALPFLQHPLATVPQTEGISALTSLSQSEPLYREILLSLINPSSSSIPLLDQLPVELHTAIGQYLDVESLTVFASLSDTSFEGCFPMLRDPCLAGHRLLSTKRNEEDIISKQELLYLDDEYKDRREESERGITSLTRPHFVLDDASILVLNSYGISRFTLSTPFMVEQKEIKFLRKSSMDIDDYDVNDMLRKLKERRSRRRPYGSTVTSYRIFDDFDESAEADETDEDAVIKHFERVRLGGVSN